MKRCPVCGTKYANDKEFCEIDRAYLEDCPEEETKKDEQKKIPFDKKRLATAAIYACVFIAFIVIIYSIAGGGFKI